MMGIPGSGSIDCISILVALTLISLDLRKTFDFTGSLFIYSDL